MTPSAPDPRSSLAVELRRWVGAGFIGDEQAEAIAKFESERTRAQATGRATRAIALLGALTLVCGVGSLVAYNWWRFGSTPKLLGMAALLLAAAGASLRARQRQTTPVSTPLEVSLMVTSGLSLAGLALVSQVYDQDGELWQLLFFWCAFTAPLMSCARSRFAHVFWYVGLATSLISSGDVCREFFQNVLHMNGDSPEFATVIVYSTISMIFCARWAASRHSARAQVGLTLVLLHLVLLGLFGGLSWLEPGGTPILWCFGIVSIAAVFFAMPSTIERVGFGSRAQLLGLCSGAIALAILPMGLQVESGLAAFIAFGIFWAAAWWLAEAAGHLGNARLAVFALGVRVVIASFELFESLLVTGAVLVALGIAALTWSRFKWNGSNSEVAHHD